MNIYNYGFRYNHFEIKENRLRKSVKNEEGRHKLKREIQFYEYILQHDISFSIPKIYLLDKEEGVIEMEYLLDYVPLTDMFHPNIVPELIKELNVLHQNSLKCTQEEYYQTLRIETNDKLLSRYAETKWEALEDFQRIQTVHHVPFKTMDYYVDKINERLLKWIQQKTEYSFCLIHGDIHLGNILIHKEYLSHTDLKRFSHPMVYFIDPRGYFGNRELFGIKEYDYAKLLFGISGYSIFDNMEITETYIQGNNLDISFMEPYFGIYDSNLFDPFTKLLSLTIWLGNNNNFIDPRKKIMSLMIAYYLCEKFIN